MRSQAFNYAAAKVKCGLIILALAFGVTLLLVQLISLLPSYFHRPNLITLDESVAAQRALLPTFQILGKVETSCDTVPGGYWVVNTTHKFPKADQQYASRWGVLPWWLIRLFERSCFDIARSVNEPYGPYYESKQDPVQNWPGGAPKAYYQWEGQITRDQFDAVPTLLRGPDCIHCVDTVRFKILGGKLFIKEGWRDHKHIHVAQEQLLVALHLFPSTPDVDFILHFGDGCTNGLPIIQWNICRQHAHAGFTYPSYSAWEQSLGLAQLQTLHQCYEARYPRGSQRHPRLFWRGSTTNFRHSPEINPYNRSNFMDAERVQLHFMRHKYPDTMDTQLFRLVHVEDKWVERNLSDRAWEIPFEDNMRHALVLDLDGNGWSDRFVQMAHFNTPILKQASNFTAFFEHLATPDTILQYYKHDLSDLPERAEELLKEWRHNSSRLNHMAEQMQGLAAVTLNYVALSEALAYTLRVYSEKITWKPVMEPGYQYVPPAKCCQYTKLPREMEELIIASADQYDGQEKRLSSRKAML